VSARARKLARSTIVSAVRWSHATDKGAQLFKKQKPLLKTEAPDNSGLFLFNP
jgi:hypothetical protein